MGRLLLFGLICAVVATIYIVGIQNILEWNNYWQVWFLPIGMLVGGGMTWRSMVKPGAKPSPMRGLFAGFVSGVMGICLGWLMFAIWVVFFPAADIMQALGVSVGLMSKLVVSSLGIAVMLIPFHGWIMLVLCAAAGLAWVLVRKKA